VWIPLILYYAPPTNEQTNSRNTTEKNIYLEENRNWKVKRYSFIGKIGKPSSTL